MPSLGDLPTSSHPPPTTTKGSWCYYYPHFKWANWDTKRFRNLFKVTNHMVKNRDLYTGYTTDSHDFTSHAFSPSPLMLSFPTCDFSLPLLPVLLSRSMSLTHLRSLQFLNILAYPKWLRQRTVLLIIYIWMYSILLQLSLCRASGWHSATFWSSSIFNQSDVLRVWKSTLVDLKFEKRKSLFEFFLKQSFSR